MANTEQETDITLEHSQAAEKEIHINLNYYYHDKEDIDLRLAELDEELDIERILLAEGAVATIAGVVLGLTVNKKWFALPLAASAVLLAGIAKGWNRPVPLLRKLGYRTRQEIDKEKYALKALRGDFKYLLDVPNAVWSAVNK